MRCRSVLTVTTFTTTDPLVRIKGRVSVEIDKDRQRNLISKCIANMRRQMF